jgi:hypothetical protein
MHLEKLVNSKTGKVVASILLGFGLATLFRKVCKERNCIVLKAPPLQEMTTQVFKHDDKCYTFQAVSAKCDKNKKIVDV